jgi:hypothetical protein
MQQVTHHTKTFERHDGATSKGDNRAAGRSAQYSTGEAKGTFKRHTAAAAQTYPVFDEKLR